jgi:hypothetical protein
MSQPLRASRSDKAWNSDWSPKNLAILALLTVFALLVMGYHPGLEDDAFYLAAIKRNLNPSLFPHDAEFFRLQFQATIFDKLIALSVRLTHLSVAWTSLLWQIAAIFLLLHGCWRISRRFFSQPAPQWAAVTTIAALLTLPVSGTAINLADQYLHPRTLATAAILAAIVAVLDRRLWIAGVLLAVAFAVHAIMASFGISFCAFLFWSLRRSGAGTPSACSPVERSSTGAPLGTGAFGLFALAIPLGWIFEPASDAWRQAASTRTFYFLARWHWYEWLGVFAPIVLLYALLIMLRRRRGGDSTALRPLVTSLIYYGIFQTIVGLVIMLPPSLERLRPFEPMRYLHLLYLLFFVILGGLLGRYVLGHRVYRWALMFVPLGAGMFYAQRQMFPATEQVELPGRESRNAWLQAFAWIRQNTPVDSLFALDPHYVELPDEDYHGFRSLAERSALADYDKDAGMAARVPRLAPRWLKEVNAQSGWQSFQAADFDRLRNDFGVSWVILAARDAPPGMTCPYQHQQLRVCRLY